MSSECDSCDESVNGRSTPLDWHPVQHESVNTTSNHVSETSDAPSGSQCSIKHIVQRRDEDQKLIVTEKDSSEEKRLLPYQSYALVIQEKHGNKDEPIKTTLMINSKYILEALEDVVDYYPSESLNFESSKSYVVEQPYMVLHHNYEALKAYICSKEFKSRVAGDNNNDREQHIQLLLDFLQEDGKDARKLVSSNLINFRYLWHIYKPGNLLFEASYGQTRLLRITDVGYGEKNQSTKFLELRCEFTSCDGEKTGTASTKLKIWEKSEFVGKSATAITSLSAFPFEFLGTTDDRESIKSSLISRGRSYLEVKGVHVYEYNGLHLYLKTPPREFYDECSDFAGVWLPATTNGRVVIDAKTFGEEMKRQADTVGNRLSSSRAEAAKENEKVPQGFTTLDEADPLLCPPYIFGFCLETKAWCKFFVENLQPANWTPNALDSLVVPTYRKEVIRALVSSHRYGAKSAQAGTTLANGQPWSKVLQKPTHRNEALTKGLGLVILLHGVPGSGKTLTAELMAEHTQRPLLNISTGELGSWQHSIAIELKRLLTFASMWRAIVLIDEADVFLEARRSSAGDGSSDVLAQNNLVAVFLRQLEYFQGIIFLTSNRVSVFDPAVRSRIHLAMRYDAPDIAVRTSMWRKRLDGVGAELAPSMDVAAAADELAAAAEMNGREISNAVNSARTLAADKGVHLELEHLKDMVRLWIEFEGQLVDEQAQKDDL